MYKFKDINKHKYILYKIDISVSQILLIPCDTLMNPKDKQTNKKSQDNTYNHAIVTKLNKKTTGTHNTMINVRGFKSKYRI